ncbi:hypothetical protein [Paenibacillus sp. FSL K6-2524]|uniref:hypothetical protein n=1 Tax=Paenibacillus sp. FSL K6-2524 TaxID=2954516 RepID=UPI0030F57E09
MFNENEIKQLEGNPNVENVTEKSITYSAKFKLRAVKAYKEGQTPNLDGDILRSYEG